MTTQELKQEFFNLYSYMANSNEPKNMKAFGNVMKEMFVWFADNKPDAATEWLEKLSAIKWNNYLTKKEAEKIASDMEPKAPWSMEQWKAAMDGEGYPLEKEPCYNKCALYVTMNMLMSDSGDTLEKYVGTDNLFPAVYSLAVDKLTDKDGRFSVRHYFGL